MPDLTTTELIAMIDCVLSHSSGFDPHWLQALTQIRRMLTTVKE